MTGHPRIALVHALSVAMPPVETAFQELWPAAERLNLLDDALSVDRAKAPELSPAIYDRIGRLADYALAAGARAILYTCSAFGPAIEAVARRVEVPVLKPNEAMFEAALAHGRTIGMVATFAPSIGTMEAEFRETAGAFGRSATIRSVCAPAAMAALRSGDGEQHDALVAEAALGLADCDAIMLAQFSTARAAAAVQQATSRPVLTSPRAAVAKLKRALGD